MTIAEKIHALPYDPMDDAGPYLEGDYSTAGCFAWFNLGNAYYVAGDYREAAFALELSLYAAAGRQWSYHEMAYPLLAAALLHLEKPLESLAVCLMAWGMGWEGPQLLGTQGEAFYQLGAYERALAAFERSGHVPASLGRDAGGDQTMSTWKRDWGLAKSFAACLRLTEAKEYCYKLLSQKPEHEGAKELLAELAKREQGE